MSHGHVSAHYHNNDLKTIFREDGGNLGPTLMLAGCDKSHSWSPDGCAVAGSHWRTGLYVSCVEMTVQRSSVMKNFETRTFGQGPIPEVSCVAWRPHSTEE